MTTDIHRIYLPRLSWPLALLSLIVATFFATLPFVSHAAERAKVEAFLQVTGFDVALDSIAQSASNAPSMLGMGEEEFGGDWQRLAQRVFDTGVMRSLATDILEATLSDQALAHAAGFYASDLGQRLVAVENESQLMEDGSTKQEVGRQMVSEMVKTGDPRLELIKRMNRAVNAGDTSVRALQEIQVRFLLAASAAGVIKLKVDAEGLRAMMKKQEASTRLAIQESALAGAAYTYRDISDADIVAYSEALEQPLMQEVYELLNAVQYEIMANRFEVLAVRMAKLHPSQEL